MRYAKKNSTFWAFFLIAGAAYTQTSVYTCPVPVPNSALTSGPVINIDDCFDFSSPSNYSYPSGVNKEFRASKHIRVVDDFKMGSSPSSGGKFKLTMDNVDNTDIVLYEPSALNAIAKYEKMELGIDLPDNIQAMVDAFIADETDPNGLNPFLEWEIKIEATFTHLSSGFPQKKVDAFYFRDFERVVIPYDVNLYGNFDNNDDPAYQDWGGHWDPINNAHPFRIRFAPPETGTWVCEVKVFINDNPIPTFTFDSFSFEAINQGNPGYLKVGISKRFFTLGNETYVPLGPNFGWPETHINLDNDDYQILRNGTVGNGEAHRRFMAPLQTYLNYETHLNELGAAGGNHFRLIMVPWSLDIEFEKLGNYYDRQHIAWEMDNIVNTAKQNNLTIQWDFMIQYTLEGNPFSIKYWDWYPWYDYDDFGININTLDPVHYPPASLMAYDSGYCYRHILEDPNVPGVPLDNPLRMFTHPEAKKYYKQRLRYIISRWGYSTNIGMWELCSEVNNTGGVSGSTEVIHTIPPYKLCDNIPPDSICPPEILSQKIAAQEGIESWHEEMAGYIKNTLDDPHLISASYGGTIGEYDNTHDLSVIDFVSENHYNSHWSPKVVHEVSKYNSVIDRMDSYGTGKPVSFSETGTLGAITCTTDGNPWTSPDLDEFEDKRLMWLLPFSGTAIANNWSLWDYPQHWHLYKDVRDFIGNVDLDAGNWIPGQYLGSHAWEDMLRADKKASMSYLRSGDQRYSMGVINNCTHNAYTRSPDPSLSCLYDSSHIRYGIFNDDTNDYFELVDFTIKDTVSADTTSSNWLRIRNMNASYEYTIDYFDIAFPNVVIASQIAGPGISDIILQYPDLNDTHPIVAFKIYPTSSGWKMAEANQKPADDFQEMKVYPNPTNSQVVVDVWNFDVNKTYTLRLYNSIGALVKQIPVNTNQTQVDLSACENGIYLFSLSDEESTQIVRVSKTH